MELLARHGVLAEGDSVDTCRQQIEQFFARTSLVRYDKVVIDDNHLCAVDDDFAASLKQLLNRNRAILRKFIDELGATGFTGRDDLSRVEQGYSSKVIHIIAHFLDGFIGIDSAFYNLVDDSHWVTADTMDRIDSSPERFMIFHLTCYSLTPREAALLHS